MSELTTLQAAARCGVLPATIRNWVHSGKLKPCGMRDTGGNGTHLFREEDVEALVGPTADRGRPRTITKAAPPIRRLATPTLPDATLPMGLKILMKIGRFRRPVKHCQNQHVQWDVPIAQPEVGGGVLLGQILFGSDWLNVYRHTESGVIYHQQAEWMSADPDWMDTPEHAETYVLLAA